MSAKRLLHITFCFILITASAPLPLTAQQLRYNFKNYTPSDGLPSSEVYQVLRDSDNYMWFATDHGICRYNGYEFKTFNLADNSILGMFEDNRKRLWAYSFSGRLFYYENGKFKDYKWNEKLLKAIKPRVISGIYVDSNEVVHITASGPSYFKITTGGIVTDLTQLSESAKCFSFKSSAEDFFTGIISYPANMKSILMHGLNPVTELIFSNNSREMHVTVPVLVQPERCRAKLMANGEVFFFARNCFVKTKNNKIELFTKTNYSVDDILLIDSTYFFATSKGLIIKNSKGEDIASYFDQMHITSIELDYEGGLWLSSLTNGLFYLTQTRIRNLASADDLIREPVKYLLRTYDSMILFGNNNSIIYKFKENEILEKHSFNVKYISTLFQANENEIFVGAAMGFAPTYWQQLNSDKAFGYTFRILPNGSNFVADGSCLYSGLNDGILKFAFQNNEIIYSTVNFINNEPFRSVKLFISSKKQFLVGNHFGLWNFKEGKIYPYSNGKDVFKTRVTDIIEYKNKFLCVGTRGAGLIVEGADDLYEINTENGLISNNIRRILIENNHIWLATNRGISIITVESEKPFNYSVKNLSVQDGLLSNEVNDMIDYGEQVVIASNSGMSFLNKLKILTTELPQLPFYITGISSNGVVLTNEKMQNLSYNFRNVSISFDALNFSNPGKNNYRYRLSGYDTSWIYTNDRTIQFNPLPYGNFKLEIQAKREFDSWNQAGNTFSLDVVCNPPFWSSVWFYALLSALFGFASFIFFRRRVSVLKKRQNEKESLQRKISETEQMALKSQMNPHFIFNCLNSIQQYVIESDVEGANRFITGFSKLIRQTLDFSAKDKISLEEEMSYLTNYLGLEKARMEDQFKYEVCVQCNHQLSELHVPPLLLQPYVENAIRHGVRHLKNREGVIKLTFKEKGKVLECTIEDNGIGRKLAIQLKSKKPIEYQSKGMSLTAERVELLNKTRENPIQIKVEDIEDHVHEISGTRIILMFPQ